MLSIVMVVAVAYCEAVVSGYFRGRLNTVALKLQTLGSATRSRRDVGLLPKLHGTVVMVSAAPSLRGCVVPSYMCGCLGRIAIGPASVPIWERLETRPELVRNLFGSKEILSGHCRVAHSFAAP